MHRKRINFLWVLKLGKQGWKYYSGQNSGTIRFNYKSAGSQHIWTEKVKQKAVPFKF